MSHSSIIIVAMYSLILFSNVNVRKALLMTYWYSSTALQDCSISEEIGFCVILCFVDDVSTEKRQTSCMADLVDMSLLVCQQQSPVLGHRLSYKHCVVRLLQLLVASVTFLSLASHFRFTSHVSWQVYVACAIVQKTVVLSFKVMNCMYVCWVKKHGV
jgi:hypothetical protein